MIINYRKNVEKVQEKQLEITENQYKNLKSENVALLQSITKSVAKHDANKKRKEQKSSEKYDKTMDKKKMSLQKFKKTEKQYSSYDYKDPVLSTTTDNRHTHYPNRQSTFPNSLATQETDLTQEIDDTENINVPVDVNIQKKVSNVELYQYNPDSWREITPNEDIQQQHHILNTINYEHGSEGYMYDSQRGYQYPLGRSDVETEDIAKDKLPKQQNQKTTLKSGP